MHDEIPTPEDTLITSQTTNIGTSSILDASNRESALPSSIDPAEYLRFSKEFQEFKNDFDDKIKTLNNDKISIITVLGIFVSIFTFISVEVQILRYICDFNKIIGLTLIIPAVLIIFCCSLDYLARLWIYDKNNSFNYRIFIILIISIALMVTGLILIKNSNQTWMCKTQSDTPIVLPIEKTISNEVKLPSSININLIQ